MLSVPDWWSVQGGSLEDSASEDRKTRQHVQFSFFVVFLWRNVVLLQLTGAALLLEDMKPAFLIASKVWNDQENPEQTVDAGIWDFCSIFALGLEYGMVQILNYFKGKNEKYEKNILVASMQMLKRTLSSHLRSHHCTVVRHDVWNILPLDVDGHARSFPFISSFLMESWRFSAKTDVVCPKFIFWALEKPPPLSPKCTAAPPCFSVGVVFFECCTHWFCS